MTLVKFNSENKKKNAVPSFNDVFDSIANDTFFSDRMLTRVPAANISETTDHFHIELAAPGLDKGDFKLKLEGDVLSVSVEQDSRNSQAERTYAKREYNYSSFLRAFTLPDSANTEHIQARYTDGVLCIEIPKREEAKLVTRQIEIQ